jgi:hypothetical protein
VHKTFRNLIQIIESIGSQTGQGRVDKVALCLKEALVYEGKQNTSLQYLSSFFIAHAEAMYRYDPQFNFNLRINKIISRMTALNTLN